MSVWIALLRGVNVGGITIRSADLADVFRGLGFEGVRTVLASGNVRFEADATPAARATLKASIEEALRERFGYDAWIVLITADELQTAIDGFPFDATDAARQPWVIFCSDASAHAELIEAAAGPTRPEAPGAGTVDPIAAGGSGEVGIVYWNPVKGTTTDTPFAKVLSKSRYRATTTNRNLRTLAKLVG